MGVANAPVRRRYDARLMHRADLYREKGLWRGVPFGEAFERSAADHGDRTAASDGTRRLTYRELRSASRSVATSLARRGLCDGAAVVFQMPNVLELVVAYVACLEVGAVPVACLPHHREAEIIALATLSGARGWIFPDRFRDFDYRAMATRIAKALPEMRERIVLGAPGPGMTSFEALASEASDDALVARHAPAASAIACLQLSGGTTGIPKLIARTHDDYLYNSLAFAAASGFGRDDVLLVAIPAAHNFPLACPGIQGALLLGARTVLASSPSADVVFPIIERERVTWIPAVPATLMQWTERARTTKHDLSSIRAIYVGGQKLNPEPARAAMQVFGAVVRQVFGMAEGLLCCTRPGDDVELHAETQGRPVSELDEIRIVDDDGCDVPPGEMGELLCRGPYTIGGYYRAEAHNAKVFTPDGFYKSGDIVRLHPSGNIVVEGRKKDLINRGGEKISAEEVENLLLKHHAIANVAVVAMPDPMLGERACACVVLREGSTLTLAEITRFLHEDERIAAFKIPERLEIFDELPITGVGKISKRDLRGTVAARLGVPPIPESSPAIPSYLETA